MTWSSHLHLYIAFGWPEESAQILAKIDRRVQRHVQASLERELDEPGQDILAGRHERRENLLDLEREFVSVQDSLCWVYPGTEKFKRMDEA